MKKYTLMLSVLFATILFIGCGNTTVKCLDKLEMLQVKLLQV